MKTTLLIILSLFTFGAAQLFANAQLIDLNREWLNQTDINVYEIKNVPTDEVGKIKMHLRLVEQTLRSRSTSHLSKTQLLNRAKSLDILHTYWQAGVFPQNESYAYRTPIFIDKYNTFCAVGHIMQETGGEHIARAINEKNNLIYVREIKNTAAANWINESGLTMEECAWIQPGYGGTPIKHDLDLSGLSITNPIVNRAIVGSVPASTFSASVSSTGGTNPTFDANGNALFGLGSGSVQCINLSFQGAPNFLMRLEGSINVLGGTFDTNDSLNLNNSLIYGYSNPFPFQGGSFAGPSTYLVPTSNITQDTSWFCDFFPTNYTPAAQFTICAARTTTSNSTNTDLPLNLAVLIDATVQVEYEALSLKKSGDDVTLHWSTLSEHNNNYFTIEKSLNASSWESIGQVWSKGNSSDKTTYFFTDIKPKSGTYWYRVKSTDLDGGIQYSQIKSIRIGDIENALEVLSANPVANKIVIKFSDADQLNDVFISNAVGQKMSFNNQVIGHQIEFDVAHFPAGIYFIKSQYMNYKFIKK